MAKKVNVIKALPKGGSTLKRLRVCAYARVSTGSLAQNESYETQIEYYSQKIIANPLWEFAGIYADEAVSGTKLKGRDDFAAMVEACEAGEIDLVITKSIARFARNTLECIETVRKLRALDVGVFFEEENINTLYDSSELMLTILAAIAQSESEDISKNYRWAVKKRFEDGSYIVSTPAYGYYKDEEKNLVINEKEAEVVRWIFKTYLNGTGAHHIADILNKQSVPTIREGKRWHESEVRMILINPVYEGNALWQKTYREEEFPFKAKVNKGEVAMYFIQDAHPAIVSHEEAEAVRNIMEYRKKILNKENVGVNAVYTFSGKINCGDCGRKLRRQKVYVGRPYETVNWICPRHAKESASCHMKAVREDHIQEAFIRMWNKLYTNQGTLLEPFLKEMSRLAERQLGSDEMEQLNKEIHNLCEQSRILNQTMRKGYMDSALFIEKNNKLVHEITQRKRERSIKVRKMKCSKEIAKTEMMIGLLKSEGYQTGFSDELFFLTVERIEVTLDRKIIFYLQNGLRFTESEGRER